ncbi:MAG: DUF2807 domain-containing protein [Bacteroidetes bacterium]|nr:DUF2807 domain-containing protein [Bacteroidota bacterium]
MKNLKTLLIATASALIFFQSCSPDGAWAIKGEGAQITETKDLSNFDAIELEIDADVIYVQDSVYKVEIKAQQNILAIMEVEVEGNELQLDFRRNVWKHDGIEIIVHSPHLKAMTINGSGNVNVTDTIEETSLELLITGSGNIKIAALSLQSLDAKITGSGNVTVDGGVCSSEYLTVTGSGNMDMVMLSAQSADVKITGSGEVSVAASNVLKVDVSGSGNVKYKGNPSISKDISGSGDLIHLN